MPESDATSDISTDSTECGDYTAAEGTSQHETESATVEPSTSVQSDAPSTSVQPIFTTPAARPPAKSRKRQRDDVSAVDDTLTAIAKVLAAHADQTSKQAPQNNDDEDTLFGKLVDAEMRKINNVEIKRQLKKTINDSIFDAQTRDDAASQEIQGTKFYVMQEDGTLAEVQP